MVWSPSSWADEDCSNDLHHLNSIVNYNDYEARRGIIIMIKIIVKQDDDYDYHYYVDYCQTKMIMRSAGEEI